MVCVWQALVAAVAALPLRSAAGNAERGPGGPYHQLRQRCLGLQERGSGIRSPRVALDCGTALAASHEPDLALSFYEAGLDKADPVLHAAILPKLKYQAAIAERSAGRRNASAARFADLLSELKPPDSLSVDWWHEGLTALRDAYWHDDAERLFKAAVASLPRVGWVHSWQLPRDVDKRALSDASPFHEVEQFEVSQILQAHAAELGSQFDALLARPDWDSFFEVNEHEAGGNVAAGRWRHMYLKRLNGSWDAAGCEVLPLACTLLRGRPEIDGVIFNPGPRPSGAKPKASTQGVAVLELAPGTHLRLHSGRNNFRLLAHLGLRVPAGLAGIAIAGQLRFWEEGSVLVLDDSYLHEAWNNSTSVPRYVLYASFFPPSLEPELPAEASIKQEL